MSYKLLKNMSGARGNQTTKDCIVGDLFLVEDPTAGTHNHNTLLRDFDGFVSLDDPSSTWSYDLEFYGRKLNRGESRTLEVI